MNQLFVLKITVLLISMLTIMAGTPISPALPKIAAAFAGENHAELLSRLVLTMPALFTVLGAPLAGLIADRHGRRPLVLVAMGVYVVAGVSGYFGQTLYQILAGRALLGLAVGGCTTAATTLISDYFATGERVKLLGYQAAFSTGGGVIFISLGGLLAEIGWRFPFLIYLMGVPVLVLASLVLVEPVRTDIDRDSARAATELPWGFIAILYGIALLGIIGFFTAPIQMPFFLQRDFGVNGVGTGLIIALATIFASASSFFYGRIRARVSYGALMTVMFAIMGCSYMLVGLATSLPVVVLGLCTSGVAAGWLLPAINNWVADITGNHNRGRAIGIITTAFFLGQFLAPVVMMPVIAVVDSFSSFFWFLGIFLLGLGIAMSLLAGPLNRRTALLQAKL